MENPSATSHVSARSAAIDALRGVAILLVLQWHFFKPFGVYPAIGLPPALISVLGSGAGGVDLFFVLSAYLLCRGLLRQRGQTGVIAPFYIRRAFRILPMFVLVVVSGIALSAEWRALTGADDPWLWANQYPAWAYFLFLHNWYAGLTGPNSSYFVALWSLAVEEHFYLFLPLLVLNAGNRGLALLAAASIASAPFIRDMLAERVSPYASYYWTIARIDSFGWGILIALAPALAPRLAGRVDRRLVGLLGGAVFVAASLSAQQSVPGDQNPIPLITWMALSSALVVFSVVSSELDAKTAARPNACVRALSWFGARCYSLYILHKPILGLVFFFGGSPEPSLSAAHGPLLFVIATALTLALSDVAYRRIELPFIAIGRKIAERGMGSLPPLMQRGGSVQMSRTRVEDYSPKDYSPKDYSP